MKDDREKYEKLTAMLSSSYRMPPNPEKLVFDIMSRVRSESEMRYTGVTLSGLIFGWTSVAWVRRMMLAASVAIIALFAYQQSQIITGLRKLESRYSADTGAVMARPTSSGNDYLNLMMFRGRFSSSDSIRVSVDDINNLIGSYKELEVSVEKMRRFLLMNPELVLMLEKEYGESVQEIVGKPKM
jgi:hypothetical protein